MSETIGPYRITSRLGEGGMGAVYEAQHSELGRRAAVKVLHSQYFGDQALVQRFFHEAKAAATIEHPGIITIYEFGFDDQDGRAYIAMELLRGETLQARLERAGRLAEVDALRIGRQIAAALAAAHEAGIVHRDLKPENVFIVPDPDVLGGERVKLLDFGIAKLAEHLRDKGNTTRSGVFMGTPAYASPEQCEGARTLGPPSDLYSLGCILYHGVCGRPPFVAEGVGRVIAAHIYETPAPPKSLAPHISPGFAELLGQLLAKSPEQRPNAAAVSNRLRGLGARSIEQPVVTPRPQQPPPATGSPTTLSEAAGQGRPSGSSTKLGFLVAAGLAVLVAAGASIAAISSGGDEQELAPPAASPPPIDAPVSVIDAALEPALDAAPAPKSACAFDDLIDLRTEAQIRGALRRVESCRDELGPERYRRLQRTLLDQLAAAATGMP